MGIPVYFKTLVSEYQDTILHKHKINNINYLFLDLNCLIHPCCRGLTVENEMMQNTLSNLNCLALICFCNFCIWIPDWLNH